MECWHCPCRFCPQRVQWEMGISGVAGPRRHQTSLLTNPKRVWLVMLAIAWRPRAGN